MKTTDTLLTFTLGSLLLLLYGCTGCGQKTAPPTQTDTPLSQQQLTPKTDSDTQPVLTAQDIQKINPYDGITQTGQPPPDDYYGDPIFWIPSMQYRLESEIPGYEESAPILPNDEEIYTMYKQRRRQLYEAQGGKPTEEQLMQLSAETFTEDLTPLDAVKYLVVRSSSAREYKLQLAQQALDANPDDFHTLLVWTAVQFSDTRDEDAAYQRMIDGYRRLLEMKPNSAFILYRLGGMLGYKHYPEQIPLLEKAIRLAPEEDIGKGAGSDNIRDGALLNLAENYFFHDEKEKALETLNRLVRVTTSASYRELTQERIRIIQEENRWAVGLHLHR